MTCADGVAPTRNLSCWGHRNRCSGPVRVRAPQQWTGL